MGARGSARPCALLLLLLLLLPGQGGSVLGAPPRLVCDNRVLERYVLEAKEAENVTMGCTEGCSFGENLTVPDTKVNFQAWRQMEEELQAAEVRQGLALLSEAILRGQALLVNTSRPPETLKLLVDKAVSGLRSLASLVRRLSVPQKEAASQATSPSASPASPATPASPSQPLRTLPVDTFGKLFRVYSNFLRGKVTLYAGEACRRGNR